MKKILLFRPLICMGGTEKMMWNLLNQLSSYDIYIGYTDEGSDQELIKKFSKKATVLSLNEPIDLDFDVAIACTWRYHQYQQFTKLNYHKLFLWVHNLTKMDQSVLNFPEEYQKIDTIISVSQTLTQKLIKLFPNVKDKILTIYNLLDQETILEKAKIPISLELSHDLNLVTVARVCWTKGFRRMLKLAKELKKANISFKWFVVGGNYNKEEENEIKEAFQEFQNEFVWFGFSDNPHSIVAQCDYSVLLSDEETWGLALTEAMILHIPCICTDFDAACEQIVDGENGIILKRDAISYQDRIPDIMNHKEKYKMALSNFTYSNEKILKEWEELIHE